jgi:hypothetical protein
LITVIPKINAGTVTALVKDPCVLAVISASLIAPILQKYQTMLIDKIPFLKDHKNIAFGVFAVVIFAGASKTKGVLRAVLIGVAGANVLLSIAPLISKILPTPKGA